MAELTIAERISRIAQAGYNGEELPSDPRELDAFLEKDGYLSLEDALAHKSGDTLRDFVVIELHEVCEEYKKEGKTDKELMIVVRDTIYKAMVNLNAACNTLEELIPWK